MLPTPVNYAIYPSVVPADTVVEMIVVPCEKSFLLFSDVTYTLTEENSVRIDYYGVPQGKTIVNLTNHSYFNLNDHDSGSILNHTLWLDADTFTPADETSIPTGEIRSVEGTPMDFRNPKTVGLEIDSDYEATRFGNGYDHNWCLDNYDGNVRLVAEVTNGSGSRTMQVYTDLPGVQFYAANSTADPNGKGGVKYAPRCALCLETQFYPNAVNEPSFPSPVFGPGKDCVTDFEQTLTGTLSEYIAE